MDAIENGLIPDPFCNLCMVRIHPHPDLYNFSDDTINKY